MVVTATEDAEHLKVAMTSIRMSEAHERNHREVADGLEAHNDLSQKLLGRSPLMYGRCEA